MPRHLSTCDRHTKQRNSTPWFASYGSLKTARRTISAHKKSPISLRAPLSFATYIQAQRLRFHQAPPGAPQPRIDTDNPRDICLNHVPVHLCRNRAMPQKCEQNKNISLILLQNGETGQWWSRDNYSGLANRGEDNYPGLGMH